MPPRSSTERLAWVDIAKAIAITLVAIHHAVIFTSAAGWLPSAVVQLNNQLVTFRMPLFFLASGMFAASALSKPWPVVLRRRVLFYGYLYVLWTTLRFAWFQLVPDVRGETDGATIVDLLRSMVLPDTGLWFLFALAAFTVVAKAARPLPPAVQLLAAGAVSAFSTTEAFPVGNYAWRNMATYFIFFLIGMYGSARIRALATGVTPAGAVLAGVVAVGLTAGGQLTGTEEVPGLRLLTSVAMVTFGVCIAALLSRTRLAQGAARLGGQTLPIYLLHIFIISGLVVLVSLAWQPPPAVGVVAVLIIVAMSMAISLMLHRVIAGGAPWLFSLPRRAPRQLVP